MLHIGAVKTEVNAFFIIHHNNNMDISVSTVRENSMGNYVWSSKGHIIQVGEISKLNTKKDHPCNDVYPEMVQNL